MSGERPRSWWRGTLLGLLLGASAGAAVGVVLGAFLDRSSAWWWLLFAMTSLVGAALGQGLGAVIPAVRQARSARPLQAESPGLGRLAVAVCALEALLLGGLLTGVAAALLPLVELVHALEQAGIPGEPSSPAHARLLVGGTALVASFSLLLARASTRPRMRRLSPLQVVLVPTATTAGALFWPLYAVWAVVSR